jgi:hypothetical protein
MVHFEIILNIGLLDKSAFGEQFEIKIFEIGRKESLSAADISSAAARVKQALRTQRHVI